MVQLHKSEPIFVGRRDELKRFGEILASPKGQAVLVVGPQGMGKTLLVNKMARMAQNHPSLKCGTVRYEVTKTDDVATTMALMIDHAFEAVNVGQKFLSGSGNHETTAIKVFPSVL